VGGEVSLTPAPNHGRSWEAYGIENHRNELIDPAALSATDLPGRWKAKAATRAAK